MQKNLRIYDEHASLTVATSLHVCKVFHLVNYINSYNL